jgi:hypothetical protein
MAKTPEKVDPKQVKEIAQKSTSLLDDWYKRNSDRIRLIGDLQLDCDACKSKEAKGLLQKELDLSLKGLKLDLDKLNKQNEALFKDVPVPTPEPLYKLINSEFDKRMTIYSKDGLKVKFDAKSLIKGPPSIKIEF